MQPELPLSEARASFSEIVADIATTGPVTVLLYGRPAAVIAPYVSSDQAGETAMREHLDLFERAGTLQLARSYINDYALNTPARMREFLDQVAQIPTYDPEYCETEVDIPDGDIPELVAAINLGFSAAVFHEAGQPLRPWSDALLAVVHAAGRTSLSHDFDYREDSDIARKLLESGLTPAGFVETAARLRAQGVALGDLIAALGEDAIPADVLALGSNAAWAVGELRGCGLPLAEACQVLRAAGPDGYHKAASEALKWVAAGVLTHAEIERMKDSGLPVTLAKRAAHAGMTPAEWEPVVAQVARWAYDSNGHVPWNVIVEAAGRGVSLIQWDKNPHAGKQNNYLSYVGRAATDQYPWSEIYPDHVLELAEAGVSPGLVIECLALFPGSRNQVPELIRRLAAIGLKLPVAKAMNRTGEHKVRFRPSVEQVARLVKLGITEAEARHLIDTGTARPEAWVSQLEMWREAADKTAAWITDQKARPGQWDSLHHLASTVAVLRKDVYWFRHLYKRAVTPLAEEALKLLGDDTRLHYGHLMHLMSLSDWALSHPRLDEIRLYLDAIDTDAVRRMMYEFQEFMRTVFQEASKGDSETSVSRHHGGARALSQ